MFDAAKTGAFFRPVSALVRHCWVSFDRFADGWGMEVRFWVDGEPVLVSDKRPRDQTHQARHLAWLRRRTSIYTFVEINR